MDDSDEPGGSSRGQSARLAAVRLINEFTNMLSRDGDSEPLSHLRPTFDITLAAKHEYLGSDLEELRGRTLHEEGSIHWIPIFLELDIILIPGQTLPMTVFYPPTIQIFRDVIVKDKTFGIIWQPHKSKVESTVGTTAEIYQFQEGSGLSGFKIKAKGRQRFKLLEKKGIVPGMFLGKVMILPEVDLESPVHEARLLSLDRFRKNHTFASRLGNIDSLGVTWPKWICNQYDCNQLVSKLTKELRSLKLVDDSTNIPTNANTLSFWVAQCLPFDGIHRNAMLNFNTAVERLQYALRLLDECGAVYCQRCGQQISSRKDIFSMSVEGPQGTYCNPGGHVHEILTVYRAEGIILAQETPSTEYSWFPGYGWTIASCGNCNRHTGWLFSAMTSGLTPVRFWGLSRRAVTMHQTEAEPVDPSVDYILNSNVFQA